MLSLPSSSLSSRWRKDDGVVVFSALQTRQRCRLPPRDPAVRGESGGRGLTVAALPLPPPPLPSSLSSSSSSSIRPCRLSPAPLSLLLLPLLLLLSKTAATATAGMTGATERVCCCSSGSGSGSGKSCLLPPLSSAFLGVVPLLAWRLDRCSVLKRERGRRRWWCSRW